jgi:hypothetical protein
MAVMTAGCLLGAVEQSLNGTMVALIVTAWIVAIGSLLTCATRIRAIAVRLRT